MKSIISALAVLGFLAGAASAAPVSKVETQTVVEWGCGYGH